MLLKWSHFCLIWKNFSSVIVWYYPFTLLPVSIHNLRLEPHSSRSFVHVFHYIHQFLISISIIDFTKQLFPSCQMLAVLPFLSPSHSQFSCSSMFTCDSECTLPLITPHKLHLSALHGHMDSIVVWYSDPPWYKGYPTHLCQVDLVFVYKSQFQFHES